MMLSRFLGCSPRSFSAPRKRLGRPRHVPWSIVGGVTLFLALSVALAYASPPDPSWIQGIYDDRDSDEFVQFLTDGVVACAAVEPPRIAPAPMGCVPRSTARGVVVESELTIRGPPADHLQ